MFDEMYNVCSWVTALSGKQQHFVYLCFFFVCFKLSSSTGDRQIHCSGDKPLYICLCTFFCGCVGNVKVESYSFFHCSEHGLHASPSLQVCMYIYI